VESIADTNMGDMELKEPLRIERAEARQKVLSDTAIFVCAYEDEKKFRRIYHKGAILISEF
jgi:hypothetical protein